MFQTGKSIGRMAKAGMLLSVVAASLLAAPQISVDNADVNLGTLIEGKQKVVEHVYLVKNTGDAVLHIKQVRPG